MKASNASNTYSFNIKVTEGGGTGTDYYWTSETKASTSSKGRFAFYAVEGETGVYKILDVSKGTWLTYSTNFEQGQGKIYTSETSQSSAAMFKINYISSSNARCAVNCYEIQPYYNGNTPTYLNWCGGPSTSQGNSMGFFYGTAKTDMHSGWCLIEASTYTNVAGSYVDINAVSTSLGADKFTVNYNGTKLNSSGSDIQHMYEGCYFNVNMNVLYKGDYKLSYDYAVDKDRTGCKNSVYLFKENGDAGTATLNYNTMTLSTTTSGWANYTAYGTPLTLTGMEAGNQYVRIQWASSPTSGGASGNFKNFKLIKTAGYVEYDYNDGVTESKTEKVTLGTTLSLTPTRTGFVFKGWFDENGTQVTTFNRVDNPTLYAHWSPVDIDAVSKTLHTSEFNCYSQDAGHAIYNVNNETIGCMTSGNYFDMNLNILYKGDYKLTLKTGNGAATGYCNISLNNASGASFSSTSTVTSKDFNIPKTGSDWNPSTSQDFNIYNLTSGKMYIRILSKGSSVSGQDAGNLNGFTFIKTAGYVTYNYNDDGATASKEEKVNIGDALSTPTRAGYTFAGWYDSNDTKVETYNRVDNPELTATWTPAITDASGNVVSKDKWIEEHNSKPNDIAFAGKGADVEGANNVFVEQEEKDENDKPIYKANNLVITDGTAFTLPTALSGKTCKAAEATYTRTTSSNWGTICLPYAVESDDYVQYYELSKVDTQKGVMSFTAVDNVDANTPAVFCKKDASATSITAATEDETIVKVSANPSSSTETASAWTLKGTYAKTELDQADNIYYIAQNQFWCANQIDGDKKLNIPAYRAYFTTGSNAKASRFTIAISDGDSTTAIGTIDANGNIQITDGKFIQNGKVTIVKNGKKYNAAGQNIK